MNKLERKCLKAIVKGKAECQELRGGRRAVIEKAH